MGYTLTIGEMAIDFDRDEDCPNVLVSAEGVEHENAPAFGEPTDRTNSRWPSYSGWSCFCKFVGLYDLFFGENEQGVRTRDDALLAEHPGAVPLTERHRREVNAAYEAFKIKYPNASPTYGNATMMQAHPDNPEENAHMCRLVWLRYWINWALDNCKQPVFYNS